MTKSVAVWCLVLFLGGGTAAFAADKRLVRLEYKDEPLQGVLERVAQATGFDIVVTGRDIQAPVSGRIDDLPVEDAIRKILHRFNFAIVWDDPNQTIRISVYEGDGSIENRSAGREPSIGEQHAPAQLPPSRQIEFSDRYDTGSALSPDHPSLRLPAEDRRFIQGTRTTGP